MLTKLRAVTIRPAELRDINVMAEIAHSVMPHPWSRAIFSDCFKQDYYGFVITQGELANQVIGFVIVLSQLGECQVLNICVRKSQQRCGYGRQLLLHVIDFCKQGHVEKILLEVRCSNQIAMHCYRSVGLQKVAVRRDYYPLSDGREDAFIFKLIL